MNYLIQTTEVYRIPSESEVKAFIEEQKSKYSYEIKKYSSELKQVKQKGEIVDEYYKFSIVKNFNNEKEPENPVSIKYED